MAKSENYRVTVDQSISHPTTSLPSFANYCCRANSQDHPLTSVVGLWATLMVGTGAYLYSKPMKPSIRVIYARLVAQAGVVTGILGGGLATFLMQDEKEKPEFGSLQIRELTNKEGKRIRMEEVAAQTQEKHRHKTESATPVQAEGR